MKVKTFSTEIKNNMPLFAAIAVAVVMMPGGAFAQLEGATTIMETVFSTLESLSLVVAACALIWGAWTFFRGNFNWPIIVAVLVGCIIAGNARDIAGMFLGG